MRIPPLTALALAGLLAATCGVAMAESSSSGTTSTQTSGTYGSSTSTQGSQGSKQQTGTTVKSGQGYDKNGSRQGSHSTHGHDTDPTGKPVVN